jgi:signal transduction histidine kinase
VGESAVLLPWLAPGVASLVALTRPHRPASARTLLSDPGALLLLFRQAPIDRAPEPFQLTQLAPAALYHALHVLDQPPAGYLDPGHPAVRIVLGAADRYARVARRLAERSGWADPDCAAAAGRLVPLGWLAAAADRPDAVAACLGDSAFACQPEAVQQRHWGATAAEIARRLARRWELPTWLAAVVGYLELPAALAPSFGAEPALFTIIQAAVALTARHETDPLRLAVGSPLEESLGRLGLEPGVIASVEQEAVSENGTVPPPSGSPYDAPHLRDLLELAAENASRREVTLVPRLETEIDRLHGLLLEQRSGEAERLRAQKLTALAEFAAGAGHEINNPLAVISGQAQYLLNQDCDPNRQRSLRTVVQQAQRIHQILTELMQFARPPRPQKGVVDLCDAARAVADSLAELAAGRQVQVELSLPDEPCAAVADPKQLHTALGCLLRNAIEAAPATGWARLRVEPAGEWLRVAVEDSGPGPVAAQAEHLFDPFFSGRPAGRGRGLGLPTAWRLAREQGGDVTYEPLPHGPTRFVLSLPRATTLPLPQPPERLSA